MVDLMPGQILAESIYCSVRACQRRTAGGAPMTRQCHHDCLHGVLSLLCMRVQEQKRDSVRQGGVIGRPGLGGSKQPCLAPASLQAPGRSRSTAPGGPWHILIPEQPCIVCFTSTAPIRRADEPWYGDAAGEYANSGTCAFHFRVQAFQEGGTAYPALWCWGNPYRPAHRARCFP